MHGHPTDVTLLVPPPTLLVPPLLFRCCCCCCCFCCFFFFLVVLLFLLFFLVVFFSWYCSRCCYNACAAFGVFYCFPPCLYLACCSLRLILLSFFCFVVFVIFLFSSSLFFCFSWSMIFCVFFPPPPRIVMSFLPVWFLSPFFVCCSKVDGDVSFLRLHFRAIGELLPPHGNSRLLFLPLVYQRHLLFHQGEICHQL